MIYMVASELRAYLAREPFAERYRPILDRFKLISYRSLTTSQYPPASTFLLCSVSSFSPSQHAIALQWEQALSDTVEARVLNRPSLIRPWHEQMRQIARESGSAAPVWPLSEHFFDPRYPIMLRQQTSDFQVESPVLTSGTELNEILDRMVMAGADPSEIWAVQAPESRRNSFRSSMLSLVKIGPSVFTVGESPGSENFAKMKCFVDASPMDAAAFDFALTDDGPCLWRIDDDLGRILLNLIQAPTPAPTVSSDQALMAAILALDGRNDQSAGVSVLLNPLQVQEVLTS